MKMCYNVFKIQVKHWENVLQEKQKTGFITRLEYQPITTIESTDI